MLQFCYNNYSKAYSILHQDFSSTVTLLQRSLRSFDHDFQNVFKVSFLSSQNLWKSALVVLYKLYELLQQKRCLQQDFSRAPTLFQKCLNYTPNNASKRISIMLLQCSKKCFNNAPSAATKFFKE